MIPIRLSLDFSVPQADEAKRALTRIIDQINIESRENPQVKLNDVQRIRIGQLVTKFNNGKIDVADFKEKLLHIYHEARGEVN